MCGERYRANSRASFAIPTQSAEGLSVVGGGLGQDSKGELPATTARTKTWTSKTTLLGGSGNALGRAEDAVYDFAHVDVGQPARRGLLNAIRLKAAKAVGSISGLHPGHRLPQKGAAVAMPEPLNQAI